MDRALWLHLVAVHSDPLAVVRAGSENEAQHKTEHSKPYPAHPHPVSDMSFNLDTAKAVLAEYITDLSV